MIANRNSQEAKLSFKTYYAEKTVSVCKPERASGAWQDRRQQTDTRTGAEKDEETIRQLWSEPIHGLNTSESSPTTDPSHHGYCLTEVKYNEVLHLIF